MAKPEFYKIPDHYKGDDFLGVEFTLEQPEGVPIDLTGASIEMMLKTEKTGSSALTLSTPSSGLTITDPTNGVFTIDEQNIDVDAADYFYDIKVTLSGGEIRTYVEGTWLICQNVTFP